MKIVFMGTPDFAVPVLEALVAAGHDVVAAYSQPPRPAGRGKRLTPSPVQARAESFGITVRTPSSLRGAEEQAAFAALGADVAVVAAYGLILPRAVLDAPVRGCLNVHASLLPRWRGAAPIQRAILAGDAETGVCIMQMEAGLDTGPVLLRKSTWIGVDSADKVTNRLSALGAEMMTTVLAYPDAYRPVPQRDEDATYAPKIDKAEAHLKFDESAAMLARKIQAFSPWPGAFFQLGTERLKIHRATPLQRWRSDDREPGALVDLIDAGTNWGKPDKRNQAFVIACGEGYLLPTLVQRPGKAWLPVNEFLNGAPTAIGSVAG